MSQNVDKPHSGVVPDRLRAVVWGTDDSRLRAIWRFLLAIPLVLLTEIVARAVGPAFGLTGLLPTGLIQAGAFAVLLVGWARYIDRRRLTNYGLSVSDSWLLDLFVAFSAVVGAHGAWYALGSSLGWTSVEVAMSSPQGSLVLGLTTAFVAIAVNVWVQDTVFFGVVLKSAAEGFRSRGLRPRHAVVGGWLVGILFVVWIHSVSVQRALGLTVAGTLFGLLYVHTGELALPIGFHLGVNFSGGWLFPSSSLIGEQTAVFTVTETLPILEALSEPRIPQMVVAYLMVVTWLWWRRGNVAIESDISQWTGR